MRFSFKLFLIFSAALLLRLALINSAHHGDLNNNISWGSLAVERGLNGFYGSANADDWPYSAPNQPPLTLLMFAGLRIIWLAARNMIWYFNWELLLFPSKLVWFWDDAGMRLLVKLPAILADLGIGWLIYKYLSEKKEKNTGLLLATVWLFNPVVWYNSSVWGQTDSIVNLLGLIGISYLLKKDILRFVCLFTVSLLFKGSLAIFIPILFFVLLKQRHPVSQWIKAIILSLIIVFITSIWFHRAVDIFPWLINLYQQRILPGEIGYLTANAFNFWWLVDAGRTLDSTVYLGLPARTWGFIMTFATLFLTIYWLKKDASDKKTFFSLSITSLAAFLFLTRVHERYMYPFFPLSTILLGFFPSVWMPYILLSVSNLLNLYHLFWAPSFPLLETVYTKPEFAQILCLINIFAFFVLLRHLRSSKI